MIKFAHLVCATILSSSATSGILLADSSYRLQVGSVLPDITVAGEHGGSVTDGGAWASHSMQGHLHFVVYVDPDDANLNNDLTERLDAEKYPEGDLDSVALINLAASWKPNALIMSVLRGKQKEYPLTTYVFDKDKYVAQQWDLIPEGFHVLLIDANGKLIFEKAGQFSKQETDSFLALVKEEVSKNRAKNRMSSAEKTGEGETKKSL